MPKLKVGVVFGGRSGEHEVSLMSAQSVIGALDPNKYEIVPIGIAKTGKWVPLELIDGKIGMDAVPDDLAEALDFQLDPAVFQGFDVIFPVLHGTYGEDGTIQGFFEMLNIPFVGAGVLSSAMCMDKAIARVLFEQADLPLVPWEAVLDHEWLASQEKVQHRIETSIGYPCFVKPANSGSSVGITKVKNGTDLRSAMDLAFEFDRKVVVEQAARNAREVECSVLGNDEPQVSIPGEIIPANEFYDYEAKYHNDNSRLIIPADTTPEQTKKIQEYALQAYQAVDCAGMARIDFFITDQREIYLNEINTIPGFTRISMYPKLWEASGVPYSQLVDRLIALALDRHKRRQKLRTSLF